MIFQNSIVRFIAFFIPVKNIRESFILTNSRKTKYAKLREDNKRLFIENKSLLKEVNRLSVENIEIKQSLQRIENILKGYNLAGGPESPHRATVYLSVLCISKNEGSYLKEWIEYHKLVGVERFYFYDNDSSDNTKEVLEPYIKAGNVIYHEISGNSQQFPAYRDCIRKYARETRWLAIIDIDEFIVPIEKESISNFLKDYEKYPAVGINWVNFDSNGHETKPSEHGGLVIANYTRIRSESKDSLKGNQHIKSIVNPKDVITIDSPHYAVYMGGTGAVTENFDTVYGAFTNIHSSSKIQINHYYTKSREEYIQKCQKGRASSNLSKDFSESHLNFKNPINDLAIQKYLPRLKKAMGIND